MKKKTYVILQHDVIFSEKTYDMMEIEARNGVEVQTISLRKLRCMNTTLIFVKCKNTNLKVLRLVIT